MSEIGRVVRLRERKISADAPHHQATPQHVPLPENWPRAFRERTD